MSDSIRDRRVQYETAGLDVGDVAADPMAQWQRWHDEAFDAGIAEPNAMTLSTNGLDGIPDARIVLARGADESGFAFYTNYDGAKSRQLDVAPVAAATFGWLDLHRQVRVRGQIRRTSAAESDAYFNSRPRSSQLGAWSSPQSQALADRGELDALFRATEDRFDGIEVVPRPENWGGWRLTPIEWEFWQGRPSRLHDRLRYRREDVDYQPKLAPEQSVGGGSSAGTWLVERLAP